MDRKLFRRGESAAANPVNDGVLASQTLAAGTTGAPQHRDA
jgi:hypothetical protein